MKIHTGNLSVTINTEDLSIAINDKKFCKFDDISFTVWNEKSDHFDRVIGRIIHADSSKITVDRVEINRAKIDPNIKCGYNYQDIVDINYVA